MQKGGARAENNKEKCNKQDKKLQRRDEEEERTISEFTKEI